MIKTKAILTIESRIGEPLEIFLEREYRERTMKDIAGQISVSQSTLKSWTGKFGIPLKTRAIPSKEDLLLKYQEKNSNQIAEEYRVTGRTVRNWMEKYGIGRRVKMPSREELSVKCETTTLAEIADDYDVCLATVKGWRRNYGIATRKRLFGKSAKKTPEKTNAGFGAHNGRKRDHSKKSERAENNFQTRKNEESCEQGGETTLENLINRYNPLFENDRNAAMKEIFGDIMNKRGDERLAYMNLHRHYSGIERASV